MEKAKDHPNDAARNLDAAKLLYKIAGELDGMTSYIDDLFENIRLGDIDVAPAVNAYITSIGFRAHPESTHAFLSDIDGIQADLA
ncbi:MAG: hypothetical protein R3D70_12225 [Rhizobiaceae bacterium]